MRNLVIAVAALCAAFNVSAVELKIAVVDPLKVIADTEVAKVQMAALEKDTAADRGRHEKLSGDLQVCKRKLTSELATMAAADQARVRTDCDTKLRDWQALSQSLQTTVNERQQTLLKDMSPKLQKAVDALAKEAGYDLIIHREAALFMRPDLDVSAKLTAKLNLMK